MRALILVYITHQYGCVIIQLPHLQLEYLLCSTTFILPCKTWSWRHTNSYPLSDEHIYICWYINQQNRACVFICQINVLICSCDVTKLWKISSFICTTNQLKLCNIFVAYFKMRQELWWLSTCLDVLQWHQKAYYFGCEYLWFARTS